VAVAFKDQEQPTSEWVICVHRRILDRNAVALSQLPGFHKPMRACVCPAACQAASFAAGANGPFTRVKAGRLSVFAHKQRTNQWFDTLPKLATMLKMETFKVAAPRAATFALTCSRGFLQDNRAAFETFEEKTPWPKQHHQKTTS
jgi:hypothetical protein